MNSAELKKMLLFVAQRVIESKELLTEVDSAIGDGDHGIGMENGFKAATEALGALADTAAVRELFAAVGKSMLMTMGGASGALFGTLFSYAGKSAPAEGDCSAENFAAMMRSALDGVKMRGKAEIGDKTMVDSLEPAVIALEQNASAGFAAMTAAASDAAWQGVEATKNMMAKFGRAKNLMERAIGHQDAGATTIAIMMTAMADFFK